MNAALLRCERAAGAAEFALVLPVLILFLFGIIDGGRLLWETNRLEKATQVGARVAVVTDVVAGGIAAHNFVGTTNGVTLTQGDPVTAAAFGGTITCTSTSCTCPGGGCIAVGTYNGAAFTRIVTRMQRMKPDLIAANVAVDYRASGLGYAGDPNGMDASPLVTVRIRDDQRVVFRPITALLLAQFNLPVFATTLTAEDSLGSNYN